MADAYTDVDGGPILAQSFALFIDALGTKATAASLTTQKLGDLLERRSKYLFMLDDNHIANVQRTAMFTDNIVVGHADASDLGFLRTCFHAAAYQLGATLVGEFQRGGMAFGPMYVGDGIVHGQALMDAYELETSVAEYPRIVLSPGLRRRLVNVASQPLAADVNADVVKRMFVLDEDGDVFLDYLRVMSDFEAGVPSFGFDELGEALDVHKQHVEAQLEKAHSASVRAKYVWLADYHNWAVSDLGVGHLIDHAAFRADRDPDERRFVVGWAEPTG